MKKYVVDLVGSIFNTDVAEERWRRNFESLFCIYMLQSIKEKTIKREMAAKINALICHYRGLIEGIGLVFGFKEAKHHQLNWFPDEIKEESEKI